MATIKLGLAELSIPEKISLARDIADSLTGNASFPVPDPTLASITAAANTLETDASAAAAARQASQIATLAQDDTEAELDRLLTTLAAYVQNKSGGDEALILSSGMGVKGSGGRIGTLPAPDPVNATSGDASGEIDLGWPRTHGAGSFIIQIATAADAPESGWVFAQASTKSTCTLTGLVSGTRYWIRVAAVGSAGQGAWSSVVTARAA